MWRLWTRGFGPRDWWHWFKEQVPMKLAFCLPRRVAYWAFIRVYARDGNAPGPEFKRVCDRWEIEMRSKGRSNGQSNGAGTPTPGLDRQV